MEREKTGNAFAWTVDLGDVGHLVARMFDATREDALVVVSPASDIQRPRIDVTELARLLPPGSEIATLATMAASTRLSDLVDSAFQCYGGGVRVVLSGAARSDNWRRHRLFTIYPDDDPHLACRQIARHVEESATPATVAPSLAPVGALRPEQAELLRSFRDRLESSRPRPVPPTTQTEPEPEPIVPVEVKPESNPHAAAPVTGIGFDDLVTLLDAQAAAITASVHRAVADDLLNLLGDGLDMTARERSRADQAEEALAVLQRRYDDLRERDPGPASVYTDTARQLRWEIDQEWLTGTPEAERVQPLRGYALGPGFLSSLNAQIVPRQKTIQVIVDILARRVWDRRQCHQFDDAARGGSQRVRSDGATAWRVYVKAESPGAPRLIWWELPDQTVELEYVGHHDALL